MALSTSTVGRGPVRGDGVGGLKVDRARDILRDQILFRSRPPGAQLTEQAIAGELGCSQGTVREALMGLAQEGLVERRGYRGTIVTETTLAEAVELVRIRVSIEGQVARRLSSTGLGDAEDDLHAILGAMDAAHEDGDLSRCGSLDRGFHVALCRAAGLPLLCPLLARAALHMHRFTLSGVEIPRSYCQEAGIGDEHRVLLQTLVDAEPDAAAAAMSEHVASVLRRWAPSLLSAAGERLVVPPLMEADPRPAAGSRCRETT